MFAIILAVIAIALAILMTVVTINYLYEDGSNAAKAEAAQIIQEASQIRGAILIAKNDGLVVTTDSDLAILTPKYLTEIPQGGYDWILSEDMLIKENVNDNVCLEANSSMGFEFSAQDTNVREAKGGKGYIPFCDKAGLMPNLPCCDNSPSVPPL